MLSITHKLIAEKVYEAILSELKVDIDVDSLKEGSIAPDIFPSMMFLSHSIDGSMKLVKEAVDRLCSMKLPENKKEMKKFSFNLGIVIHFISDYFCKAHNDRRYDNLILHYIYERKLKRFFEKRAGFMKHSTSARTSILGFKDNLKGNLMDYIIEMHMEYKKVKKSMTNDLKYSMSISTNVALNIVARNLSRSETVLIKEIA